MPSPSTAVPQPPKQDPATDILLGRDFHARGELDAAQRHYDRALAIAPEHPDALNLAGALAFARGDHRRAVTLLHKAVVALPSFKEARENLAEALAGAGDLSSAIRTYRGILADIAPDCVETHVKLANLLLLTGGAELALRHSQVAIALEPDAAEAVAARLAALAHLRRYEQVLSEFPRALARFPGVTLLRAGYAQFLESQERYQDAATVWRSLAADHPDNVNILLSLAEAVGQTGDMLESLTLLDRAVALSPTEVPLMQRGYGFIFVGDFDRAAADFQTILRLGRSEAQAAYALARIRRPVEDKKVTRRLESLTRDNSAPAQERLYAGFALGEAADQAGQYGAAFTWISQAQQLQRQVNAASGEVFKPETTLEMARDIIRTGSDRLALSAKWGVASSKPLFITGFSRAGTTLVEQICAGHSQIAAAGELHAMDNATHRLLERNRGIADRGQWDAQHARRVAAEHVAALDRIDAGATYVTDKMPVNVYRLDLIFALFPQARVICCRRDVRDVVVSNYFVKYRRGNPYATDLTDCALAYRVAEHLGEFWHSLVPDRVLLVDYERLVADPATEARRIIAFLGLPWESACLGSEAVARPVRTHSFWQVRQPISAGSVGRWRRYAPHLGPLFDSLKQSLPL